MEYQADQWRRTRQLQVLIVRVSVILIGFLTAALVIVILWPVRSALERREESEFGVQAQLVQLEVRSYFDQTLQLSLQLPSRTRIREELVAYLSGKRTLDSYVEFTQPKLQDAVDASPGMVATFRFGPEGEPLTGAYVSAQELPPVRLESREALVMPDMPTIRDQSVVLVQVPIEHPGYGLAGFDIVAVSVRGLRTSIQTSVRSMSNAVVTVATSEQDNPSVAITSSRSETASHDELRVLESLQRVAGTSAEAAVRIDVRSQARIAALDRVSPNWYLVVHQSEAVLFQSVSSDIRLFLIVVIVLGLSAVGVAGLVLGILSRRTLAETGQLSCIVDQQTEELTLLLNEVHHRVKNDIMLMNAFLSLKAADVDAPEAKEALAEAQKSLLAMGRVYELLHRSGDYGTVSLRPLFEGVVEQARAMSGGDHVLIDCEVDDVRVDRRTAVPLTIIVNELLTNAVKHGSGHNRTIRAFVTLTRDDGGDLTLSVSDDGERFEQPVLDGAYGFGLRMVQALAEQLGGQMIVSNEPAATVTVRVVS